VAQLTLIAPPAARPTLSAGAAHAKNSTSSASDLANANFRANVRALSLTQPHVVDFAGARDAEVPDVAPVKWTFARDGSLTAFDGDGRWWDGCSVPLLAARAMLKTLDPQGRVACFLRPTLAAHVRVALETLREDQAVVAVMPEIPALRVLLHCGDFSRAIRTGRLWFAAGGQWPAELARVFIDNPGLTTPSQFIRLPVTPADEVERLVKAAQEVFAEQNAARAASIAKLRGNWQPSSRVRRLCVLAPSHFRLWETAGETLVNALARDGGGAGVEVARLDPDRPTRASLLAFASAAASCDAVITADVGRADLPGAAPAEMPWVTWVTTPRVPPHPTAEANDFLLVADEAWKPRAVDAGWPAERVHVASWPAMFETAPAAPARGELAIVADTSPLDPPERLKEFSSHLLLWERLRRDLAADPFRAGDDPEQFLERTMRQCGVADEGLDRRLFVERLIVPAYQQGLAAILLREKLPLRLYGAGWDRIEAFRDHAAGPVGSFRRLRQIARETAALVNVWPRGHAHAIDALGRPVVRRRDPAGRSFVGDAMRALSGHVAPGAPAHPPLTLSRVVRLLEGAMGPVSAGPVTDR
jgi:hypothetical protein